MSLFNFYYHYHVFFFNDYVYIRDAPDSGFYYLAGYRMSRIVKNYPAGLFGRIVVM